MAVKIWTLLSFVIISSSLFYGAYSSSDDDIPEEDGQSGSDDSVDPYSSGGYGGGAGGDPYGYGGDSYGGGGGDPSESYSSLKQLTTSEDIKSFLAEEEYEPTIIGYFDESTNSADKSIYEEVAKSFASNYRFAISTSKELLEELKYDGCVVIVYKPSKLVSDKYEKAKSRYPSKTLKRESLEKFIAEKSLSLVSYRSSASENRFETIKSAQLTLFAEVDVIKSFKSFQYYANRLRKIAQDYKNKIVFEIAKTSEFTSYVTDFGLELSKRNDVGVGIRHKQMFYKMTEEYSPENIKSFCDSFLAGKLVGVEKEPTPSAPSHSDEEEEEDSSTPSAVVTLTDKNFQSEVTDSDKDAMVEFYAPWCGHCKQLKPLYSKLANKLKDVSSVTIGAMDATTSTVPKGYEVQGYPTLFFVPAGDKKNPIPYNGERTVDAMVSFIQEKATNKFTL